MGERSMAGAAGQGCLLLLRTRSLQPRCTPVFPGSFSQSHLQHCPALSHPLLPGSSVAALGQGDAPTQGNDSPLTSRPKAVCCRQLRAQGFLQLCKTLKLRLISECQSHQGALWERSRRSVS